MTDRFEALRRMIVNANGEEYAKRHYRYSDLDLKLIESEISDLLMFVPKLHGACVGMSTMLAVRLNDAHNIPAVVVAGNLQVDGIPIFETDDLIPILNGYSTWDGHCWVEIAGYICDVSLLRSAYSIEGRPSVLRSFATKTFGIKKGGFACKYDHLKSMGMSYDAKSVLPDSQFTPILSGMMHIINEATNCATQYSRAANEQK